MSGGTVNGNVYGGSRQTGTIYGNVNVNMTGGTVETSVYGGGEGGSTVWSSSGTFVTGNIYVTIGNRSLTTLPTINQNVYGVGEVLSVLLTVLVLRRIYLVQRPM